MFFPRKKAPKSPPQKPPQNSPGNLFGKMFLGYLQKPSLEEIAAIFAGALMLEAPVDAACGPHPASPNPPSPPSFRVSSLSLSLSLFLSISLLPTHSELALGGSFFGKGFGFCLQCRFCQRDLRFECWPLEEIAANFFGALKVSDTVLPLQKALRFFLAMETQRAQSQVYPQYCWEFHDRL